MLIIFRIINAKKVFINYLLKITRLRCTSTYENWPEIHVFSKLYIIFIVYFKCVLCNYANKTKGLQRWGRACNNLETVMYTGKKIGATKSLEKASSLKSGRNQRKHRMKYIFTESGNFFFFGSR